MFNLNDKFWGTPHIDNVTDRIKHRMDIQMIKAIRVDDPIERVSYVVMHPDNKHYLQRKACSIPIALPGLHLIVDTNVPKYATKWQFPKERFWSYGKDDEQWCRRLNIGKQVETDDPVFFVVNTPNPYSSQGLSLIGSSPFIMQRNHVCPIDNQI